MSHVTSILRAIEEGQPHAAEQLLPLVYDELRRLARQKLSHEKPGQTLQATALVHEAYLRLVGPAGPAGPAGPDVRVDSDARSRPAGGTYNSRGHFFAAAAEAMRRILVDQARRRNAAKRGGDVRREEFDESRLELPRPPDELLAVHDLLDRLAEVDPVAASLVKLRFFVGLNMTEVAQALGISVRSAHDRWAYARAWLHQKMVAE
jgi:RNA polymerase sigma factor (sigma-70 family)